MSGEPRFLVDGMLVRLGKYLRCLGLDAAWDESAPSRVLARRADAEERVFLTRNTRLGEDVRPPRHWIALAPDDPVAQLREVLRTFELDPTARLFTRCIRCNVELVPAAENEVAGRVAAAVLARHRRFFRCPSCDTVFWWGSHVANTCRKLGIEPPAEAPA